MTISRKSRNSSLKSRVTAAVLPALLGIASAGVAWACTANPFISIHPVGPVRPGATVTVDVSSFGPGPVEIRWQEQDGPLLATAQGPHFSETIDLPREASADVHYVVAVQRHAGTRAISLKASAPVQIDPQAPEVQANASEAPAPPRSLAQVLAMMEEIQRTASRGSSDGLGELWAGFRPVSERSLDAASVPAERSNSGAALAGLGISAVGGAALLAGGAIAVGRRRRTSEV